MDDIPIPDADEIEAIRAEIEREREEWDPHELPESQAQLVRDIRAAGGPDEMIVRVGAGIYHDYASPLAMPKQQLVADCQKWDLPEVAQRTKRGDYDP